MKIKVVDSGGNSPNIFQLFIRNITFYIWPIEALLVLFDKKKIGDRIARTNVVEDHGHGQGDGSPVLTETE